MWEYNPAVARPANTKPPLRPFKGNGRKRERDSETDWFPVEFLIYYGDHNKFRTFAYVRKENGAEIPAGHYVFEDDLGEYRRRWRKWKGKWQIGWRYRNAAGAAL